MARSHPPTLIRIVERTLHEECGVKAGDVILVAVSGGHAMGVSRETPREGRCRAGEEEERESADKPGSVESSHSSALHVAVQLKRPTRELVWAHSTLPYSVLLRVGFALPQSVTTCAVRSYRTISPLPAITGRRYFFCCTFRRLAPPRRYLAPCPMEPGLSSRCYPSGCLADSRREVYALCAQVRSNR